MRPPARVVSVIFTFLVTLTSRPALTEQISNLAARHRDGQTFLTWTPPPGSGWAYRVYGSPRPITQASDLSNATLLGTVGDSTWCDLRLSRILGTTCGYAIDSAAAPLTAGTGLFVVTAPTGRLEYYAATAQAAGAPEDRTLAPGGNTLLDPVTEVIGLPRPVYQRNLTKNGGPVEVYTLWTGAVDTPLFPAMANRAGLAFDCGIVRGDRGGALMIHPHPYGQNFLLVTGGSGEPGEWRLTLDDPLPNGDNHTWWFGYHEGYDVTSGANSSPGTGRVNDYTLRRMVYTIEWARRSLPVDWTRIYASGGSMGGVGSLWLAFKRPDLIAAVEAEVPRFDFSFMNDPNTSNLWNSTGGFRSQGNRLWGTVDTDLPSSDGIPIYDRLNMSSLAAALEKPGMPPVVVFNGKNDRVLGWAEKIPFYAEMNKDRLGGIFFWDLRTHTSAGAWDPMRGARCLYRYRINRSFPALSNCSADFDPGDGSVASGDSVGAINAFVEWDTTLVDRASEWATTLRLRDLSASFGTVRAPDSLRVDVTPRRLQAFPIRSGAGVAFTVTRLSDGATVQSGIAVADAAGLLTIAGVLVYRSGSVLHLEAASPLSAPRSEPAMGALIVRGGNPMTRSTAVTFTARAAGVASLNLYDVTGRVVRPVFDGPVASGSMPLRLDPAALPNGVYFLVARQNGSLTSCRIVVTR